MRLPCVALYQDINILHLALGFCVLFRIGCVHIAYFGVLYL